MTKICGYNSYNQLICKSNNRDSYGNGIIFPPQVLKNNSFLSCSFYSMHTAIITHEGLLQVIGNNKDCTISSSLPKEVLKQLTDLPLKDNDGLPLFPISVVCGFNYTLLLVSNGSDDSNRLAFFSKKTQTQNPLFVSIGNHNPVSLFGGRFNAASIDAEGGIIFITESLLKTSTGEAFRAVLPDNEEAVSIACCNSFFYVVGSSGRVFMSAAGSPTEMKVVERNINM